MSYFPSIQPPVINHCKAKKTLNRLEILQRKEENLTRKFKHNDAQGESYPTSHI